MDRNWQPAPGEYCLENSMDRGAYWATVHGVAVRQDTATNTFTLLYFREMGHSTFMILPRTYS